MVPSGQCLLNPLNKKSIRRIMGQSFTAVDTVLKPPGIKQSTSDVELLPQGQYCGEAYIS